MRIYICYQFNGRSSTHFSAGQTKPTFHSTFVPTMLGLMLVSFDIAVAWSSSIIQHGGLIIQHFEHVQSNIISRFLNVGSSSISTQHCIQHLKLLNCLTYSMILNKQYEVCQCIYFLRVAVNNY